jgi:hypothetical protein
MFTKSPGTRAARYGAARYRRGPLPARLLARRSGWLTALWLTALWLTVLWLTALWLAWPLTGAAGHRRLAASARKPACSVGQSGLLL